MSDTNKNIFFYSLIIGTTKIVLLVAEYNTEENQNSKIIGLGDSVSDGLNRGVVVDITKTINSVTKAVEMAEEQ